MKNVQTTWLSIKNIGILLFLVLLILIKFHDIDDIIISIVFSIVITLIVSIIDSFTFRYNTENIVVQNRINLFYYKEFRFNHIIEISTEYESFVGEALIIITDDNKKHVFPSNFVNKSYQELIDFFQKLKIDLDNEKKL